MYPKILVQESTNDHDTEYQWCEFIISHLTSKGFELVADSPTLLYSHMWDLFAKKRQK